MIIMVKAELIEEPQVSQETEIVKVDNVPDVDVAIEQWDAYQKLCKGLLNDTDYQEIVVKEKDEDGNYVKVKRHFKKKSAWQKLSLHSMLILKLLTVTLKGQKPVELKKHTTA